MNFFSKNNALTIGLVAIVAIGVIYMLFFTGGEPVADVTADSVASSPQEFLFVSLASQLNTIDFDQAVLNDERFGKLIDLKTEILPEEMEREDPFAPLSGIRSGRN